MCERTRSGKGGKGKESAINKMPRCSFRGENNKTTGVQKGKRAIKKKREKGKAGLELAAPNIQKKKKQKNKRTERKKKNNKKKGREGGRENKDGKGVGIRFSTIIRLYLGQKLHGNKGFKGGGAREKEFIG